MSCDTKLNSLDYLKRKNIITDIRVITTEKLDEFNRENEKITKLAEDKYGLATDGKMLYEVERSERMIDNNTVYSRKQTTMFATPVDELFDELDRLLIEKEDSQVNQIREVLTREPRKRIAYVGARYSDYTGNYYVEEGPSKSKVNRKVRIDNKGFLNSVKDAQLLENLVADFKAETGHTFNINDKSTNASRYHQKFFSRLAEKGMRGIEIMDSNNRMHYITFPKVETLEYSDSELNTDYQKSDVTTRIEPVAESTVRSQLDRFKWYYQTELDQIYDTYSPEQVNEMLKEDKEGAINTFNELLYPNEFKNDIFVSNQETNDQIRKCK